jgi:hypothetical protein
MDYRESDIYRDIAARVFGIGLVDVSMKQRETIRTDMLRLGYGINPPWLTSTGRFRNEHLRLVLQGVPSKFKDSMKLKFSTKADKKTYDMFKQMYGMADEVE